MKIVFEFEPGEECDGYESKIVRAMKADDYLNTLWDLGQTVRQWRKYGYPAAAAMGDIDDMICGMVEPIRLNKFMMYRVFKVIAQFFKKLAYKCKRPEWVDFDADGWQ